MTVTHRMTKTATYTTWRGMVERCTNPKNNHWHIYGARGISVCARWRSFENFLADMGPRPDGMTLDRIDNSRGYEPGNCRWATPAQQSRNTERNVWIDWDGRRKTLKDWAADLGIAHRALTYRLRRWPLHKAMTTPKQGARP